MSFRNVLFVFLFVLPYSRCADILCYFPFPSVSHQRVFQPVWKELALRGHNVTVLTPDPLKDPSLTTLTEIDLSSSYEFLAKHPLQEVMSSDKSMIDQIKNIYELSLNLIQYQFDQEEVKRFFMKKRTDIDVIILESFWLPLYALSYKYQAPMVGIISMPLPLQVHLSSGNPVNPVVYEDINFYSKVSNFRHRWQSVANTVWQIVNYYTDFLPSAQKIAFKYFGNDVPNLHGLAENISLHLTYVNPIINSPRPNVPSVIEFANIPTQTNTENVLPLDLKEIADQSTSGLIYFSLGSNVKSVSLPDNLREVIMGALSELPYTCIWKWEADDMPGKPSNVHIRKWLPQQSLLAHPNVKAFVTQGGLQSIEEAIINGVPMVGMPFFGDQHMNVIKLHEKGIAIHLDKDTVTKEQLKNAILEVAQNTKYREKAVEAKNILSDQPMKSLDLAIWWIEYVIRHKGARHLRSPALDIPWYQYYLLDVIGATLLVIIASMVIVYRTSKYIYGFIRGSRSVKVKSS